MRISAHKLESRCTMTQEQRELKQLAALRVEAERLIARLDDAGKTAAFCPDRNWAAVKRASLDLNNVGARLRAGYYNDRERHG